MPLKKKKIKEKEWKGVGKSLKQNKKIMDRYWGVIKKKENTDKPIEVKELKVEKHKTWKEHNAWLDTFRAKIITKKGDK